MTDTTIAKDHQGDLWSRVRSALNALRPVRPERAPAYGQAAIARYVGMKPKLGARIDEELAQGWTYAAARRVSLSLLVIEIDRFAEYFAGYGRDEADYCLTAVLEAITGALPRESDSCQRLGASSFVIVLPDMPALMARATATKIADSVRHMAIANKESHAGIVTLSMGLAVTNPQGNYDRKFFEAGAEALKKARRRGMGRMEGVDLRPALERKPRRAA